MQSLVTLIAFKICWLSIVLGAVWSAEWVGLLAIAAFITYEVGVRKRKSILIPTIIVGLLGFAVDNAYVATGLLTFSKPGFALAPYWMALLWVNFALIVEYGLAWLNGRPVLAATLGAIGGPMAYSGGRASGFDHPRCANHHRHCGHRTDLGRCDAAANLLSGR